ncbi:hypothetical protein C9374_005955 [Naegleria lovaniensis]|uniref:Uncharacterized protein n=1 Tax=Naegleria lovaniensis TaxID=51637 RepID=A0AA88GIG0_NAELO|nr:uncharacterized protein C9374_005955 [Naegleria lovaniensis]KAG2381571.1 hypothetical protein C9374_005955 [Naegleria lovaniensis]
MSSKQKAATNNSGTTSKKKSSSSSENVKKKKKDTISTPCLVQFTNSLSAPPNLSNIHFSLVKKDDDTTPFLFGESKSMQYKSLTNPSSSSSSKCFIIKEESKQNLQRKDILKRELEQGGADALQPDISYQHFFEKRVIGGSEVADSLFNSKRYARLMQKRATAATTSLKADQMETLKVLVGRNSRSSSMATMRQYIPTVNIEAETVNDLFDLKTDLLFDDKHLIDHFKGKHCRNKSLQRVWKVLEGATMDNGALTEEANTSITSMTEFKNLPSFLQEYFGVIIQHGNWNAIAKKKRRRKKKSDEDEDAEEEGKEKSTNAEDKDDPVLPAEELTEEQFSSFLQAIASDIPSLAQYYMVLLGIFQIAQTRRVKDHVAAILQTCYVQGTLDKKAVQKIGKKENSSHRSSVKFTSMADIFPNPPIESMKTHPYLYLPKSAQTLQDLLLRLCVPEFTKSSPRHFQHLVFNQSVGKTLLIRTANHLLVAVLLMCNFYVKKEFIVALQKDTRLTVEKLLVCFNALGVIPDSNQVFVHRTIRSLVRAASGVDFASNAKSQLSLISTEGHGAHPAHVNFYLSLPKIKQLYGKVATVGTSSTTTASTKKKETKTSKKKESAEDLLVDEDKSSKKKVNLDDDEVVETSPKQSAKKSTSSKKAEKTSAKEPTKPTKESAASSKKQTSAEATKPTKTLKRKEEDENIDNMSEDDEDIENDLDGLLMAFQAQEDEDFEEDDNEDQANHEDEDEEMAELVDEDEVEAERERAEESDNEEELVENTLEDDEEDQDGIGALLDTLGDEEDLMDEGDDEDNDDEVGVKEALSGKKKRKNMNDDDDDEEAGVVKSNKKTKHDFEQDIEEGEDEESEEDEE